MSNTLSIVIAASVFAGGVGAVATTALISPGTNADPADGTVATADAELLAAVDVLREANRTLVDRIEALELGAELAPVGFGASRTAASVDRSEIEGIVKDVLGSLDTGDGVVAATPAMQAAVESVLDMREDRERQEREAKRAEAQAKRMEDRIAKLQTDLGLDQNQTNSMRTILQDEDVRRDDMRTQMREARDSGNMDMGNMRQIWTDMRDVTNQAVQGVLNPTQYDQYQESQSNNRWGGRGAASDSGRTGRRGN